MKLLWASPLPPVRTGVSDYAVELLGELERVAAVRVVRPPAWEAPADWSLEAPLVDEETLPAVDELQLVHIGNNPHHDWLLPRLQHPRTVAVLHDGVVHHLLVETTLARGLPGLRELLVRAHGASGEVLARARVVGATGRRDPFLFPATGAVLETVAGVVVHSRWLAGRLAREQPTLSVVQVPLAASDPGTVNRADLRSSLGVPPDCLLLMHLGFLTREKGLLHVLEAVAAALRRGLQVQLALVGEGGARGDVAAAVSALGLEDRLLETGWVAPERLRRLPGAADLGVVLRTPSAGETSAAVLRFLAAGTPVAVSGLHQFLEWPEPAAPRITPGPAAAAELLRLLGEAADRARWSHRRAAARDAYLDGHRPPDAARRLVAALAPLAP